MAKLFYFLVEGPLTTWKCFFCHKIDVLVKCSLNMYLSINNSHWKCPLIILFLSKIKSEKVGIRVWKIFFWILVDNGARDGVWKCREDLSLQPNKHAFFQEKTKLFF